ncbi:MAG: efflux RND transporter periplasmic adaptor subunit [Moraxellaceae bacterium]
MSSVFYRSSTSPHASQRCHQSATSRGFALSSTVFVLLSVLLLTGCKEPVEPTATPPQPVLVSVVRQQSTDSARQFSAVVEARDETRLGFRAAGKVTQRQAEVGQQVQAGQVLATLDVNDYQLAVTAAADQLRAAQVDAKQQRADAERLARLLKDGSVGQADTERQRARADAADALEAQAASQLNLAKNRAGYTELTAPFGGVITAISFETGQIVAEGQPVLTIARDGGLDVVVDLPEQWVTALRQQQASVTRWNSTDAPIPVRLRELAPMANPQTRTYRAKFSGIPSDWRLGMTAQLRLTEPQQQGIAAELPASSLMQRGGEQSFVWVVSSKGSLSAKPVQVLRYGQNSVWLTGLTDGEQVVSVGGQKLDAAMQVRALVRPAQIGMEQQP